MPDSLYWWLTTLPIDQNESNNFELSWAKASGAAVMNVAYWSYEMLYWKLSLLSYGVLVTHIQLRYITAASSFALSALCFLGERSEFSCIDRTPSCDSSNMAGQEDPVQREIHQDWANREYIEVITSSIKKIADFLNSFGKILTNILRIRMLLLSIFCKSLKAKAG